MSPSKRFTPDAEDLPLEHETPLTETPTPAEPAQQPTPEAPTDSQPADTVIHVDVPSMSDDEIAERLRRSAEAKAQAGAAAAAAAAAAPRVTHTVAAGDTLSDIAAKYYNDAGRWPAIWEANKDVIGDNPNLIVVGQELTIPDL